MVQSIISSLSCITYLYLGILVIFFGKHTPVQKSFIVLCAMLAMWSFGSFGQQISNTYIAITYFSKIYYAGSELFVLAGIIFIMYLTDRWQSKFFRICFMLICVRVAMYQFVNIGFNLIAKDYPDGFWFISHQLITGLESLSIPILVALWGKKSPWYREQIQARIIFISTVSGTTIGILLDFAVGSRGLPPFSFVVPLFWMAAICYAILRYGLMRFSPVSFGHSLLTHIDQAVFMMDGSWTISDINGAGKFLLEQDDIPREGISMEEIFIDAEQIKTRIETVIASSKTFFSHDDFIRTAGNHIVPVIANYSVVKDYWGDRIGIMIICYPQIDLQAFVRHFALSKRQADILRHIISGRTQQQTADALFISLPTVKTHTATLYAKLGISRRSELFALIQGEHMKCE